MRKPDKTDRTQWVYNRIHGDTIVNVYANLISADTLPKLLYIHRVYLQYGSYGGYYFLKNIDDTSNLSVSKYRGNVNWQAISNTLSQQTVPQEAARILNSDDYLSKAKNKNLLTVCEDNWEDIYLYSYEFNSRENLIKGISCVLTRLYGKDVNLLPVTHKGYAETRAMFALYRVLLEEAYAVEKHIEGREENKDYYNWCNFETLHHDLLKLMGNNNEEEEEITMSEEDNKDHCDCCNCEVSKQTEFWAEMKRKGMYTPDDFNFFRNLGKQPSDNNEE